MRRLAIPALALALLVAGCGETDDSTPVACREGPQVYLAALEDAPAEVALEGETPISDCLAENQAGGALAEVGAAMLAAATKLSSAARADPGGVANVRLGYLLGAAQRGADRSAGIHAELLRRLSAAARYTPGDQPLSPGFLRAYREGFEAGRSGG